MGLSSVRHDQRFKPLEAVLCAQDLCKLLVNCELLEKWTDDHAVSLNQSFNSSNCLSENQGQAQKPMLSEIEANLGKLRF